MSQKFILFTEKTTKKPTNFEESQQRRFTRKRSDRQRSFDSKKSKQQSSNSHYIKNPTNISTMRLSRVQGETSLFIEKLSESMINDMSSKQTNGRRTMYHKTHTDRSYVDTEQSFLIKLETLQTQLDLKTHELDVMNAECDRYKNHFDEEKEKRRKLDTEKRQLKKQMKELQLEVDRKGTENKKIIQDNDYLRKQVEYLERINYDEKTRAMQSYRQRYLEQEMKAMRQELKCHKSDQEIKLENEIQKIAHENYGLKSYIKALTLNNQILVKKNSDYEKQMFYLSQMTKERVLSSPEYVELRQKYKRFLTQYKQLRAQNWSLKTRNYPKEEELELSESEEELVE